jgi:membrane protease YdiL (CAAX protease family)
MDSWPRLIANVAAAALPDNRSAPDSPWPERLAQADTVIWWVGLAVIVAGVGTWLLRSRRDPLREAPPRPNRLMPEHVLGLLLAYAVLSAMVHWIAARFSVTSELGLTVGNVVQLAGGLACLVVGARFMDGGLGRFVCDRRLIWPRLVEAVVLVFACLTVCSVVYQATVALVGLVSPGYQPIDHSVVEALRTDAEPAWFLRLGAAVIAPLAEECFFRGLLQTVLRNVLKRAWPAVVCAALLFGLAHMQQPQAVPTLVALGIVMGASYERSGSLVAPLVLHSLFNLKTLAWEALGAPA